MRDISTRTPVDRTAATVTSQRGCEPDKDLSRSDIAEQIRLLERKRRLLKKVLGIHTRNAHKNLMYKFNKRGRKYSRLEKDSRAMLEYVRVGAEVQRLQRHLNKVSA